MPTISWGLDLDASRFKRGLEEAKASLDDAKHHAEQIANDLDALDAQRSAAQKRLLTTPQGLEPLPGVQERIDAITKEGETLSREYRKALNAVEGAEKNLTKVADSEAEKRIRIAEKEANARARPLERLALAEGTAVPRNRADAQRLEEAEAAQRAGARRRQFEQAEAGGVRGFLRVAAQGTGLPTSAFGGVSAIAGAAAGAGAALIAKESLQGASEYISLMKQMSIQTGATVQEVSKLAAVTEHYGGSSKALNEVLTTIQKTALQNQAQYEQLGIKVTDSSGKVRSSLAIYQELRAVLAGASEGSARNQLAVELLGASYEGLGNVLNATPDEFRAAQEAAAGSAKVIGEDAVRANEQYTQSLKDANEQAEEFKQRLGVGIVGAINEGISAVRTFADFLGTLAQGGNPFAAATEANQREEARKKAVADASRSRGKADLTPALAVNIDPAIKAFKALDAEGQKTFANLAKASGQSADAINATSLSAVTGLQEKYVLLSNAGLLTSQDTQVLKTAQALGLTPEGIARVFADATDTVIAGWDQLKSVVEDRQYLNFSKLLREMIVGSTERDLQSVTDRIAAIDDQIQSIAERHKELTAETDKFNKGELTAEGEARERERLFLPTRPKAQEQGDNASEQRDLARLQKERATLVTQQGKLAATLADAEIRAKDAQAVLDQTRAQEDWNKRLAKATDDHREAVRLLRGQYQGLQTDVKQIDTAFRINDAGETYTFKVEVSSPDGTVNATAVDKLDELFKGKFDHAMLDLIRNTTPKVRSGGDSNRLAL